MSYVVKHTGSASSPTLIPTTPIPAARLFSVFQCVSLNTANVSSTWGKPEVGDGDNFSGSYSAPACSGVSGASHEACQRKATSFIKGWSNKSFQQPTFHSFTWNKQQLHVSNTQGILIVRGGILMSTGHFPESLSQAILVGIIHISRKIVRICLRLRPAQHTWTDTGHVRVSLIISTTHVSTTHRTHSYCVFEECSYVFVSRQLLKRRLLKWLLDHTMTRACFCGTGIICLELRPSQPTWTDTGLGKLWSGV